MSATEEQQETLEVLALRQFLAGTRPLLGPENSTAPGLTNALLVSSGGGRLYGLTVYNSRNAEQYVMIFDAVKQPGNGTVTALTFPVAAGTSLNIDWQPHGRRFRSGCFVCNSTTDTSLTLGASDCFIDAQYV